MSHQCLSALIDSKLKTKNWLKSGVSPGKKKRTAEINTETLDDEGEDMGRYVCRLTVANHSCLQFGFPDPPIYLENTVLTSSYTLNYFLYEKNVYPKYGNIVSTKHIFYLNPNISKNQSISISTIHLPPFLIIPHQSKPPKNWRSWIANFLH